MKNSINGKYEPLKNKSVYAGNLYAGNLFGDANNISLSVCINSDIKSAVEWLKIGIRKRFIDYFKSIDESADHLETEIYSLIDVAFMDVINDTEDPIKKTRKLRNTFKEAGLLGKKFEEGD